MNGMYAKVDDDVGIDRIAFLLNRTCDVVFMKFHILSSLMMEVTHEILLLKAGKK